MASGNPPSIIRDHLYSIDDRLKRGRPPPLLKGADEDIIIDEEPAPEATPVIDPASISRCCIERAGQVCWKPSLLLRLVTFTLKPRRFHTWLDGGVPRHTLSFVCRDSSLPRLRM
ncbi:unnamed protein product [Prunus brigantina]